MSLWQTLSLPWQAAVTEAWTAYCTGSFPIGAVIVDADGQIIARGRNRFNDTTPLLGQVSSNRIAHAEINALAALDHRSATLNTCALYTTMEPCPMCTGAIRMSHVGTVHYAARDPLGGSVSLFTATPFMQMYPAKLHEPTSETLEHVLIALQTSFMLSRQHPRAEEMLDYWQRTIPNAVAFGRSLYAAQVFQQLITDHTSAEQAIDQLAERFEAGD